VVYYKQSLRSVMIVPYTSTWGFQRCSVQLLGQCEGLCIVDWAEDWLHVFCLCVHIRNTYKLLRGYLSTYKI